MLKLQPAATRRTRPASVCIAAGGVVLLAAVLLGGCASTGPKIAAVPLANRLALRTSVTDLTGTGADAGFLAALDSLLAGDYVYEIVPPPPGRSSLDGATYLLRLTPNPFRPASAGPRPDLDVTIDLERAQYEPYDSAEDRLTGFMVLGVVGAALAGNRDNSFVASIQYRCDTRDVGASPQLLIRRAREGAVEEVSRREQFAMLNEDAARTYLFRLAETVAERRRLRFPVQLYRGTTESDVLGRMRAARR